MGKLGKFYGIANLASMNRVRYLFGHDVPWSLLSACCLLACLLGWGGCSRKEMEAHHLFYLHGRIVEEQGPEAVSERYGPYLYHAILDSLDRPGVLLHAELRTTDTDFHAFSEGIAQQIDSLIATGVAPEHITVVGASKGGVMGMYISHLSPHPINYVLLGANTSYIQQTFNWNFHGRVLGISDASDTLANVSYDHWRWAADPQAVIEEMMLTTGLGHGFLFRPLPEWLGPLRAWVNQETLTRK